MVAWAVAIRGIVIQSEVSSQNLIVKWGMDRFGGAMMRSGYSAYDAEYCIYRTVSLSALVESSSFVLFQAAVVLFFYKHRKSGKCFCQGLETL